MDGSRSEENAAHDFCDNVCVECGKEELNVSMGREKLSAECGKEEEL